MADQEWTVKDLMEALKRFPLEAKVYYEMGPNGPGTMDRRNTSRSGETRDGSVVGAIAGLFSQSQDPTHAEKSRRMGSTKRLVHHGSQWMMHLDLRRA